MAPSLAPLKGTPVPTRPAINRRCAPSQAVTASAQPATSPALTGAAARVRLGDSDLLVSKCCLGTMTWGQQNTEEEAHQQLNYAFENGINFIDTAEM